MGGLIGNNKKRVSMSSPLTLFSPNNSNNNKQKSSKIKRFEPNRVVGLGIVAALGGGGGGGEYAPRKDPLFKPITPAVSPRSNPIPILTPPVSKPVVLPNLSHHPNNNNNTNNNDDEMELSEDYTCVISHIGDNLIKKTEYFDGVLALHTHTSTTLYSASSGDEAAAVKTASFQAADFLQSCYLCDKHLHGLDIFMYRGEKAFCSAECRYEQMVKDEREEKEKEKLKKKNRGLLGEEATTMKTMMMNKPSFEFSSSTPCSSPIQLIVGIVAA